MESKDFNNNVYEESDTDELIEDLTTNLLKTKDDVSVAFIEKINSFFAKKRIGQEIDYIMMKNSIEQIVDRAFVGIIMQIQQKIDNGDFCDKIKRGRAK